MVKIEVDDINDNAPVFTPDEYNVTLQKNDPVGKIIVIVKALDSDSGVFGEVEYMMGKGNEDGKFAVDKDSGEITIYSALGQFPSTFQLEVIAKDKTGNKGEQNAIVNIKVAFDPKESSILTKVFTTSVLVKMHPLFHQLNVFFQAIQMHASLPFMVEQRGSRVYCHGMRL